MRRFDNEQQLNEFSSDVIYKYCGIELVCSSDEVVPLGVSMCGAFIDVPVGQDPADFATPVVRPADDPDYPQTGFFAQINCAEIAPFVDRVTDYRGIARGSLLPPDGTLYIYAGSCDGGPGRIMYMPKSAQYVRHLVPGWGGLIGPHRITFRQWFGAEVDSDDTDDKDPEFQMFGRPMYLQDDPEPDYECLISHFGEEPLLGCKFGEMNFVKVPLDGLMRRDYSEAEYDFQCT